MIGPALPNKRGLRCRTVKNNGAEPQRKAGPMSKVRFVGLDVHKDSITIAIADQDGTAPQVVATIAHEDRALMKQLKKLGATGRLKCCYEAGPTGFGLCRMLNAAGIECIVVAPSLVPKQAGDRVKTDSRDAVKLARFLRSGDLTPVHVPNEQTEAMRDLERAREDAKRAERTARNVLSKFLLRHGCRYAGKSRAWSTSYLDWVRTLHFEFEAQQRVLVSYLHAVEQATERVVQLTNDIAELVETWSLKPLVKALQALRGVQLVTAVTVAAELGEMSRFTSAPQLMAYIGLVPSEHSSGGTKKRGGITRTGNQHVRKALVESAWSYRFRASMSPEIRRRNEGVSTEVRAIAWKAQQRLHRRYQRLLARGKSKQQTVTALARELAGFIWAIGRQPTLLEQAA
jgi:transposase